MPYRQVPERHPYETVILSAFFLYGFASVLGLAPLPPSIREQVIDPIFRLTWSVLLLLGSGAALAGLITPRKPGVVKVTPILLERVGVTFVGVSLWFYALVLLVTNGDAATLPAMQSVAFGLASFMQARRLRRFLVYHATGHIPPTRTERFLRLAWRAVGGVR